MSNTDRNGETGKRSRLVPVGMKVTPEEKRTLRIKAAKRGISMSQYMRELLQEDLETEETV